MADDYDQEEALLAKKKEERRIRRALDRQAPLLKTASQFQLHVLDDPEYLVCLWIGNDVTDNDSNPVLCPQWTKIQKDIEHITKPRPATVHAKHYRIDVMRCDKSVLEQLHVSELPTALFYLKGSQSGEIRGCSNPEKLMAVYRNCLISRNQEMFEYDEAKKPKPPQEDEEGEEGEEGEEQYDGEDEE